MLVWQQHWCIMHFKHKAGCNLDFENVSEGSESTILPQLHPSQFLNVLQPLVSISHILIKLNPKNNNFWVIMTKSTKGIKVHWNDKKKWGQPLLFSFVGFLKLSLTYRRKWQQLYRDLLTSPHPCSCNDTTLGIFSIMTEAVRQV